MAKLEPIWSQNGAKIAPRWPKMRQHRPAYASMLKNIKNTMVFHYFGGAPGGQDLKTWIASGPESTVNMDGRAAS